MQNDRSCGLAWRFHVSDFYLNPEREQLFAALRRRSENYVELTAVVAPH
jgi:hypothetical protein